MSVIAEDDIMPLSYERRVDPNTLFGYTWNLKDVDSPIPEFVGISLHPTEELRTAFHEEHFAAHDRKYGRSVPGRFAYADKVLDVVGSHEFYRFVQESTGERVRGLIVLSCSLGFLQRFGLLDPPSQIDELVRLHGQGFVEKPISRKGVLQEILDDTTKWYLDQNSEELDEGWRSI